MIGPQADNCAAEIAWNTLDVRIICMSNIVHEQKQSRSRPSWDYCQSLYFSHSAKVCVFSLVHQDYFSSIVVVVLSSLNCWALILLRSPFFFWSAVWQTVMGGASKALFGLAAVAAGMALLCNLPDNPFVPAPKPASLAYLAETTLSTLDKKPRQFKVSCFFRLLCKHVFPCLP